MQGEPHVVQVLPAESANQTIDESDLYEMKDVKIETMRSRGAGGQVCFACFRLFPSIQLTFFPLSLSSFPSPISMKNSQHVNRTESAIRLTHAPTGVTVSMQDSRSQHENRTKAFKVLVSRLLALRLNQAENERRSTRRGQVSGTDRSDKIRTYAFSQVRLSCFLSFPSSFFFP
jgi:peptide chain release factor 1